MAGSHTNIDEPFRLGGFSVHAIPLLGDNYSYLVTDAHTGQAAVVDPADASIVHQYVQSLSPAVSLTSVLTTHKHAGHAGGNSAMKRHYPNIVVYGGVHDSVEACTHPVSDRDTLSLGSLTVKVLFTPCHTGGHVCYHVTAGSDTDSGAVFTGDTLFIAGAGKFFEGTGAQMYKNLIETLGSLPATTAVFCGHEYTKSNLEFARWAEPSNAKVAAKLQWAEERRAQKLTTLPSTIGDEKEINPFMRVNEPQIKDRVRPWLQGDDHAAVMAAVRAAKDANVHKKDSHM